MYAVIEKFISKQPVERQNILRGIHNIIVDEDITVSPEIEKMMGKEMIVYKAKGIMKYALSSVKNYMSLHAMPIYGSQELFKKYRLLLPDAGFQKGCINFRNDNEMPLPGVRELIRDCSGIDLAKMREEYLKKKTRKTK